jgi:hypothetical protein
VWDSCSETPFLFNSNTKGLIVYDDSKSAGIKAAYARSEGLGGVMIFDTRGFTGTNVLASVRENLSEFSVPLVKNEDATDADVALSSLFSFSSLSPTPQD